MDWGGIVGDGRESIGGPISVEGDLFSANPWDGNRACGSSGKSCEIGDGNLGDSGAGPGRVWSRRPIIVVPPGLVEQLTPRQLQWVWRHELNHVRHRDIATRWAMELVAIVYWFNPFVWIARVSLRTAQELAADSAVVHDLPSEQRIQYGRLLLVVATYDGGTVPSLAEMQLRRATG